MRRQIGGGQRLAHQRGHLERSNWIDDRLTAPRVARPRRIRECLVERLVADLDDEAHFFGDRDELGRETMPRS